MNAPTALASLRRAVADALAVVLPVVCAGCDDPGRPLCDSCRRRLDPVPFPVDIGGGLIVRSGLIYEGIPARVLRAIKEDARPRLAASLAPALRGALIEAARGHAGAVPLRVVPVPVRASSRRRRGFAVVEVAARATGVRVLPALRWVRATRDQRALTRADRARNVSGALSAVGDLAGVPVVVIDDVLTTGATLGEAVRALRAGGARVQGAAVVAATARRPERPPAQSEGDTERPGG